MAAQDLPRKVKIVEVGPRDGLQNEKETIPADIKIALVDKLTAAGFANIEAASFVSPKWVPQMATSTEVMAGIMRKPGVLYSALAPNMKGFDAALAAGVDEIVIFGAASEAFSQKNINCSIAESIERFRDVAEATKRHGLRLRAAVSCAFGCPYQGEVPLDAVADVVARLRDRPLPRHLWPGGRQHLRQPGRGHHDLPFLGRRSRRLPVCQGRDRQRRHRGCAVPDAWPGHRNRRRSRRGGRGWPVHRRPLGSQVQ
jgi:hypothetical protein